MELEIKNLSKAYHGKKALNDVSMTLTEGVYGLLGPNGAGKSTLMNIITDNIKADSGEILFNGENTVKLGVEFRKKLGYMPQQQNLYKSFTATRFLYYMAALKGMKKKDAKEQIDNALKLVNLENERYKKLSEYSGGMKQRILIAQAIIGNPDVLIFDEPTAGLDPKERIRIRNLISKIALNKIVIIATHVVSDIEFIAKEIILLRNGGLLKKEEPTALLENLSGKVFEITATENDINYLDSKCKIGNIAKSRTGVRVRAVGEGMPKGFEVKNVEPTLEDVYLYMFDDFDSSDGTSQKPFTSDVPAENKISAKELK